MKKDFFLRSTEREEDLSFSCSFEQEVLSETFPARIIVAINPAIPKEVYGTDFDLDQLVLAPRLEGSQIYPEISIPCYVYICTLKNGKINSNGALNILDWGEVLLK